jgi:hypothetical protein
MSRHPSPSWFSPLALLALLGSLSCSSGGGPTGPSVTTGTVGVTVATTGPDAPAGYMVALDGGAPRAIGAAVSRPLPVPERRGGVR